MLCSDVYEHVSEKVIVIFLHINTKHYNEISVGGQISGWISKIVEYRFKEFLKVLQPSISLITPGKYLFAMFILLSDDNGYFIKLY